MSDSVLLTNSSCLLYFLLSLGTQQLMAKQSFIKLPLNGRSLWEIVIFCDITYMCQLKGADR